MNEPLDPPEWVLLEEEEARAGTESTWVELTAEDILEHLQLAERHRANAEAGRLALLARYRELRARDGELAERSVPDEVALALRISHTHADREMGLAHELTERLPDTFAALQSGRIDLAKARALAEVTRPLPVDKARTVEEKVLPKAEGRLLAQVRGPAPATTWAGSTRKVWKSVVSGPRPSAAPGLTCTTTVPVSCACPARASGSTRPGS